MNLGTFTADNTDLIGCFKRLGANTLRLGSETMAPVPWVPDGSGSTKGQIAPRDVLALAAFLRRTGWRVIYGIDLISNTPAQAAAEAHFAYTALAETLYGFEIGNECDLYVYDGVRPATYNVAAFCAAWRSFAAEILKLVPTAPLTGPASALHVSNWTAPFVSTERALIKAVTQHYYRSTLGTTDSPEALLLTPDATLPAELQELATIATGIPGGYRIAECNTFNNGGIKGVSDAFVSALWAADFLLLSAINGASGVNIHAGLDNPCYTPIVLNAGATTQIRPLYYGMLFASVIAPGPMYAVSVDSKLSITAYAIDGNDGATYLAIINKDGSNEAKVTVDLGRPGTGGETLVLSGEGLSSLTGTTLGGVEVGTDGSWTPTWQPLPFDGSSFTMVVAAASAILVKTLHGHRLPRAL